MEVTAIVLAGGKSQRLGRSKALENVCGRSLIELVVERLIPITNRLLVVVSPEWSGLAAGSGIEILMDVYPGKGPLGGIYTGLLASHSSYNVIVACDMPFVNIKLLHHMIELAPGFDAVVPRLGKGRIEPLCAVYSKSCLGVMKTELERNQLQISHSLSKLHVRYVERTELKEYDPQLLSFFNINQQSDLDQAIALIKQNGGTL